MTDNAKHDYAEFYPADFPWDGAFVVRDIQRKDWWPYRPVDGVVDALWLLGDDSLPDGLLQGPLFRPRSGWWLAASADVDAGPRFVKATTGLLWWGTRSYKPHQGPTLEIVDDSVIEALLGLLPQIGLMSVVPLNNHPVNGVVVFGRPDAIEKATASLGGIREGQGEEVVKLWHRAGWLATL